MLLHFAALCAYAESMSFTKEYIYQASEQDSKVTCRNNALTQVKRLLLEEIGTYIEGRTEVKNMQLTRDDISSATSGIVKAEIIDESWDGKQYWVKANMTVDPDEVLQSIKAGRKKTAREPPSRSIKQGKEYRISFNSASIKPGSYGKDDSNPAPDAYILVKDEEGAILFNSGDVYMQQKSMGALLGNRNNYHPDFRGVGFNHALSGGCVSVYLMDWDGCEGFMCRNSSQDDTIGAGYRICEVDKIGKRKIKTDGWQMEVEITPAE
jgi:hypothetical protein